MLPCCNPKHLALAGLFLAAASVRAADAPAAAPAVTAQITSPGVSINQPVQDTYTRASWMVIQVDFDARTTAKTNVIDDVSVSLAVAWQKTGATPPVDLVLSSTVKLIAAIGGKRNTVFFFIPPEALARSSTGLAYQASRAPEYYLVQFSIGGSDVPLMSGSYSSKLATPDLAKDFGAMAAGKATKGLMFSEADVPDHLLTQVLSRIGGNAFPAFYPSSAAGH